MTEENTTTTETPARTSWRRRKRPRGAARLDVHRPGAIIPAHYNCVTTYLLPSGGSGGPVPGWNHDYARRILSEGVLGARFQHADGTPSGLGKCDVCGAYFIEGAIFRHEPTKTLINMGHNCADKYEMMANWSEAELQAKRLKEAAARVIQAKLNAERRARYLEGKPAIAAAFQVGEAIWLQAHNANTEMPRAAGILRDMHERLLRYQAMTPKQEELAMKLAEQLRNPPPKKEEEAKVPAPEGRLTFEGEIVGLKSQEYGWTTTLKMTVKVTTPEGIWLAWGTAPDGLGDKVKGEDGTEYVHAVPLRGRHVKVTGTLTRSDRDPAFAFFKRPKAELLPKAEAV